MKGARVKKGKKPCMKDNGNRKCDESGAGEGRENMNSNNEMK
jgi:hypothetical protein